MLELHREAELYYRLLQSSMSATLRQIGQRNGRLRQIKKAADWLCGNWDRPFVVSELAELAAMSLSMFGRSPLADHANGAKRGQTDHP